MFGSNWKEHHYLGCIDNLLIGEQSNGNNATARYVCVCTPDCVFVCVFVIHHPVWGGGCCFVWGLVESLLVCLRVGQVKSVLLPYFKKGMEEGQVWVRNVRSCFEWQWNPRSLRQTLPVWQVFSRSSMFLTSVVFFFHLLRAREAPLTLFAARLLAASRVLRPIEYFDQKPLSDLHWDDPFACGLTGSLGIRGGKAFEAVQSRGRNMSQKLHLKSLLENVLFEQKREVFFPLSLIRRRANNFALVSFFCSSL